MEIDVINLFQRSMHENTYIYNLIYNFGIYEYLDSNVNAGNNDVIFYSIFTY